MSMRSLLAIQSPELGASYSTMPIDPKTGYGEPGPAPLSISPSQPSTLVTESPEEMLAVARKYQFLATSRPGFDYGAHSSDRNALYARDEGLAQDFFGTIVTSVRQSAPGAFRGVKGSEVFAGLGLPKINLGVKLPRWIPRISVPKKLQAPLKKVAEKAVADLKAKKAQSPSGIAAQTSDFGPSEPPALDMKTWALGGAALLLAGIYLMGRRK
jgi:hypothetical protein